MDQATSMGTNRNLKGMSIFTGTAAYETTTVLMTIGEFSREWVIFRVMLVQAILINYEF